MKLRRSASSERSVAENGQDIPLLMKTFLAYAKERQTLLTVFAVLIILFGGIQMVDNPESWWVPPVVITSILAIILVFIYARVLVKVILSAVVMSFAAYFGFFFGEIEYPQIGTIGMLWAVSICLMYFFNLAVSYLMSSLYSRWTMMTLSVAVQFITVFSLMGANVEPRLSVTIGALVSGVFFFISYKVPTDLAYRSSKMPQNVASDVLTKNVREAFESEGWTFRDTRHHGNNGGYLVVKEKAYFIYPVKMTENFQEYKKSQLRYQKKPVNKWLSAVVDKEVPVLRSKNAPITPVLLDIKNGNGNNGRVIGISSVDSRKEAAFGVFPGRELNSSRQKKSVIVRNFEERFGAFSVPVSAKQFDAISSIGSRDLGSKQDDKNSSE